MNIFEYINTGITLLIITILPTLLMFLYIKVLGLDDETVMTGISKIGMYLMPFAILILLFYYLPNSYTEPYHVDFTGLVFIMTLFGLSIKNKCYKK